MFEPMPPEQSRPCERFCPECEQWKHHSRFRSRVRRHATSIDVAIHFDPVCRDCQQIERNIQKNADRPAAIIGARAASHARKAGVSKSFFMVNMNWSSLIPELRAMMTPEARCTSCGHHFLNERDIQLEHREPPRHREDWARQHSRNIAVACQSCNNGKRDKPYAEWLDWQEQCRISNERHADPNGITPMPPALAGQLSFGDNW